MLFFIDLKILSLIVKSAALMYSIRNGIMSQFSTKIIQ